MSSIQITLPDGSIQSVAAGARPIDIAKSIGSRLADAALVARVNGEMVDLTRPIEQDARLEILTPKDPAALQVYRHSTAHLPAAVGDRSACIKPRRRPLYTR
jgi:threonyl-tRNA synthetase